MSFDADLEAVLADTIKHACDVVAPHLASEGETRFPMCGTIHRLSDDAPDSVRQAAAFLAAAYELTKAGSHGDADAQARHAYLAGMLTPAVWLAADKGKSYGEILERYEVRARAEKRASDITNADHCELHSEYQHEVDKLMMGGDHKGLSYSKALGVVAKKFVVDPSTVKRHTKNKWPRKGGRHPRKT